ncbi:hypothetical protein Scep_022422 [Stephania cephalantha]|uniref:Uncharacterized protein n=1 Tax=Stephania cephalantha TaxID=152367 RepID=A0AAP0FF22_9MAGN
MEGLSHLGVQCTPARDIVDDSDEQRRGLHRQRRQRAKASEAATADGEGFGGSDGRGRRLQMQRRRGFRRQRRQRAKASEAATATTHDLRDPATIRDLNRNDGRGPNLRQTVQIFQGLGERFRRERERVDGE